MPAADYATGRAALGYTCNARFVGHFGKNGGFRVERYVDESGHECAFYDSSLITIPQNVLPVTIKGRKYAIHFDEFDSNVATYTPKENVGGVHIIDIQNEKRPKVVSRIRLAVWSAKARATDQQNDPGAQMVGQGPPTTTAACPRRWTPACSPAA